MGFLPSADQVRTGIQKGVEAVREKAAPQFEKFQQSPTGQKLAERTAQVRQAVETARGAAEDRWNTTAGQVRQTTEALKTGADKKRQQAKEFVQDPVVRKKAKTVTRVAAAGVAAMIQQALKEK